MKVEYGWSCEDCGEMEDREHCPICDALAEKEETKRLNKTCNVVFVVEHPNLIEVRGRKMLRVPTDAKIFWIPHGGKKIRRGSFAQVNPNGYLEASKEKTGMFVIK